MNPTIIMPTYQRDAILQNTLDGYCALDDSGITWQLTVADNACSEHTRKLVQGYAQSIPIHYLCEPKAGKTNALNAALPHATGELVIFTDDDAIPDSNWLKSIVEGTQRWPEYQLFGGRILPKFPEGVTIDPRIPLDFELVKAAYVIADWDKPEGPIGYGKIWGPNMVVRKCVLDTGLGFHPEIGPTPDDTFIMGDEMDFLRNAHKLGFQSAYLPDAVVHHQIRPEQLTLKWLNQRAYRDGRGRAFSSTVDKKAVKWFGIPRYHYKNLAHHLWRSATFWLARRQERYVECVMSLYMTFGAVSINRELSQRRLNPYKKCTDMSDRSLDTGGALTGGEQYNLHSKNPKKWSWRVKIRSLIEALATTTLFEQYI